MTTPYEMAIIGRSARARDGRPGLEGSAGADGENFAGIVKVIAINDEHGPTFRIKPSHEDYLIKCDNDDPIVLKIVSSDKFKVGAQVHIIQTKSTGYTSVKVEGASGVTVRSFNGEYLAGLWAAATLVKKSSTSWIVVGAMTGGTMPPLIMQAAVADETPITVVAHASQSAPLTVWQTSAGVSVAAVESDGTVRAPVVKAKALAGQTVNLQEWQSSAGTVLASVDVNGVLTAASINAAGALRSVSGNTSLTSADRVLGVVTGASMVTVGLPAAAGCVGREFIVKKVDSGVGSVVVDGYSAETVDGVSSIVLSKQFEAVTVVSNGTGWWIL